MIQTMLASRAAYFTTEATSYGEQNPKPKQPPVCFNTFLGPPHMWHYKETKQAHISSREKHNNPGATYTHCSLSNLVREK